MRDAWLPIKRRDAVLRRRGYRVLRFEEEAVRRDVATVLEALGRFL